MQNMASFVVLKKVSCNQRQITGGDVMIELKNICKSFKVAKRNSGMSQAVKSLFKKEYSYVEALKNISFTVNDGEMVGYIGPNGAGKSSTIKIMSGVLTPDSGECIINGKIPHKSRVEHVKEIGVVFGQRTQLWWDVPVIDSFELLKDIYKVDYSSYKKMSDELVELLDLSEIIKTPARQLSLGQRMRCEIAASLLHNPKILFLDEPTIGLDAVSKIAVREFIKRINKEYNTTVILTTHDMQDIEALTERILLIGKGEILLDGTLKELKNRNSTSKTITIDFEATNEKEKIVFPKGARILKHLSGYMEVEIDTSAVSVSAIISEISSKLNVSDISISSTTAEEMVVSLYEEFEI